MLHHAAGLCYRCRHILTLAVLMVTIGPSNSATPPYAMDGQADDIGQEYPNVAKFEHFNEPYDQRMFGKLNIDVVDVAPWSIHVKWRLTNLSHWDSQVESTFLCETLNGKIVSDKLHANTDSFRFQFLDSNTGYVICVHLLEKSRSANTSILHYNCQPFSTIPVLRSDSILGLMLTVGYLILVVVLGYLAWYRRARKAHNVEEEKLQAEDLEASRLDDYYQFLKAAERGGISNCAADYDRRGEIMNANGADEYKSKPHRTDCSGACVPFNAKEDDHDLVEYDPRRREISF